MNLKERIEKRGKVVEEEFNDSWKDFEKFSVLNYSLAGACFLKGGIDPFFGYYVGLGTLSLLVSYFSRRNYKK